MRSMFAIVCVALLAGCATGVPPRPATLVPANASAAQIGELSTTLVARSAGHGTLAVTLPDGEVLAGEYAIVRNGVSGFGNVVSATESAADAGARSSLGAEQAGAVSARAGRGTATATGPKGTTMSCEFSSDSVSGHGSGTCRLSTGAIFRLQY